MTSLLPFRSWVRYSMSRVGTLQISGYAKLSQQSLPPMPKEKSSPYQSTLSQLQTKMSPTIFQRFLEWRKEQSDSTMQKEKDKGITSRHNWSLRPKKQETLNDQVVVSSEFELGSPQKLNLVGRLIYGMSLGEAKIQLEMSRKRAAKRVLQMVLQLEQRARSFQIPEETIQKKMVIHSATVGRGRILKKMDIKARGRHGIRKRTYSMITIALKKPNMQTAFKNAYRKALRWIPRENRPIISTFDY
jgi:ribosomal protein L22